MVFARNKQNSQPDQQTDGNFLGGTPTRPQRRLITLDRPTKHLGGPNRRITDFDRPSGYYPNKHSTSQSTAFQQADDGLQAILEQGRPAEPRLPLLSQEKSASKKRPVIKHKIRMFIIILFLVAVGTGVYLLRNQIESHV